VEAEKAHGIKRLRRGMGDRIWVMGIHIGVGEFNTIGLSGNVIRDGL
jgi:hypothetical protein